MIPLITQTITALSVFPDRANYTTATAYAADVAAWLAEEQTYSGELKNVNSQQSAMATEMNIVAADVENDALSANASANFTGTWLVGTAYVVPSSVYYLGTYYNALVASTGVTPGTDITKWITTDSLSKAIGNINNPLLDLPMNNNLSMKHGVGSVDFTRAGTGTYIDRYRVLQTAAIDEPRFETDGLLIEGGSTNIAVQSEDATQWDVNASIQRISVTELGSDNLNTAAKYTWDNAYQGAQSCAFGNIAYTDTIAQTRSIIVKPDGFPWVRVQSSSGVTSLAFFDITNGLVGTTSNCTTSMKKLANGFYRCSIHFTPTSTGISGLLIYQAASDNDYATTGDGVDGYIVEKPQAEELPFATSYIPTTTAAVTRLADVCLATYYGNHPSLLPGNAFSYLVDFKLLSGVAYNVNRVIINAGQSRAPAFSILRINATATANVAYYRSGGAQAIPIGVTGDPHRVGVVVGVDQSVNGYVDGVLGLTDGPTDISSTGISGLKQIGIGTTDIGTVDYLFGHISNFRIYGFALTAEEVRLA